MVKVYLIVIFYSLLSSIVNASESVDSILLEYGENKVRCNRVAGKKDNPIAYKCPFMICDQVEVNENKYTPIVMNEYIKGDDSFVNRVDFVGDGLIVFPFDYSNNKNLITPPREHRNIRYQTEPKDVLSQEVQDSLLADRVRFGEELMQKGRESACDSKDLKKLLISRDNHLKKFQQRRAIMAVKSVVEGLDLLGEEIITLQADDCYKSPHSRIDSIERDLNKILKDEIEEGKILTEDNVQKIFQEVKNMEDLDFSFEKSISGCEARAHIIADRLAKRGIYVGKVWLHGERLFPNEKREEFPDAGWSFHVAPFVVVKMKDGTYERYVLDPSSTDEAVSVSEFEENIRPIQYGLPILTPSDVTPVNYLSWPLLLVSFTNKDTYIIRNYRDIPKDQQMDVAHQTLRDLSKEPPTFDYSKMIIQD